MKLLVGLFVAITLAVSANAQEGGASPSLRIFLGCQFFCDNQFIRDKLPIVDFLNESSPADVHILHTTQSTATD